MRILIYTSDKTSWALRGCFAQLDRYWPNHPPVLVGGFTPPDFALPPYAQFQSLGAFADYPADKWSNGLLKLLETLEDDSFIWTMDDFWIVQEVPDALVRYLGDYLQQYPHIARIDLTADRANSGYAQDARMEKYRYRGEWREFTLISTPPVTPYQLSFQAGLWRRKALIQYLKPGETAGESEVRGSNRMTLANANVIGTLNQPVKYKIVVQHGKVVIYEPGYQVPAVNIPDDDLAELEKLGYLNDH